MIKKGGLFLLFLLIFSLPPLFDFLAPGFPVTHDGRDHIARIANFFQNLQEGVAIPRWAGKLNWGYGHPILMFLYPMPSYVASFFHFLGFSLIDSTKLVFIAAYILSGFAMYAWIKSFLGQYAGMISGLLYIIAPYRFVDLYVRGAIGEHTAFLFPPLILLCLLKLQKNFSIKYVVFSAIFLAGLILSHNAISLMFLPIIIIYVIYLSWQKNWNKRILIQSLIVIIFGFGLSAFFWIPAFTEGKYTLRDIVTTKDYSERFVKISDFFSLDWSYGGSSLLSKQIGIVHWILILSGIGVFIKSIKSRRYDVFLFTFLLIFFVSLFLMTGYSKLVWDSISIIQKFQFPWRFLSISVFTGAVIGGVVIRNIPKTYIASISVLVIISLFIVNKNYWHANGYLDKPENFYTSIYDGTTDTGESSPIWSVRFMEKRANTVAEVIDGKATIMQRDRKTVSRTYSIYAEQESRIRDNTLYFPGWVVLVDGEPVSIEFQDPLHRGVITFYVPKGDHIVNVIFKETKLRMVANAVSLVSFLLLCIYVIILNKKYDFSFSRSRDI